MRGLSGPVYGMFMALAAVVFGITGGLIENAQIALVVLACTPILAVAEFPCLCPALVQGCFRAPIQHSLPPSAPSMADGNGSTSSGTAMSSYWRDLLHLRSADCDKSGGFCPW